MTDGNPTGLAPSPRNERLHVVPPLDGPWLRRHCDLFDGFVLEYNSVTVTGNQSARRAASLLVLLEQLETRIASGEPSMVLQFKSFALASHQRVLLRGLQRNVP